MEFCVRSNEGQVFLLQTTLSEADLLAAARRHHVSVVSTQGKKEFRGTLDRVSAFQREVEQEESQIPFWRYGLMLGI